MKRVFQRIICGQRGDCMTACVASILDLKYEEVPTWVADAVDRGKPHEQHQDMLDWLRGRGYHLFSVSWKNLNDWRPLVGVLCLASMPSQRFEGGRHAVIGTWRRRRNKGHEFYIVHDPNYKNKVYSDKITPLDINFLVPIEPALFKLPAAFPQRKPTRPWPQHQKPKGRVPR